jgi:23S rRNA (cytidine2498-2'-O)-methyltransferase
MLRFSSVTLGRNDQVLEIGCAPGGATLAMLDRGAAVFGVDPQPMLLPDRAAKLPFHHERALIEAVPRDTLPDRVTWIVLDASVAAPKALHSLQRLIPRWRRDLRGLLMVWKLNTWDLADKIPAMAAQVREMGFPNLAIANLPAFRQEVAAVATM